MTEELRNMINEFVVAELKTSVLYGITYSLFYKENKKDKVFCDRYNLIRKEANKQGYQIDELFRVHELVNGYIFDLDLDVCIDVLKDIITFSNKFAVNKVDPTKYISNRPQANIDNELNKMAHYLKKKYDQGEEEVELALYSTMKHRNRAVINVIGSNEETLAIVYDCYIARMADIKELNSRYLIPAGFRVSNVQGCEILPKRCGVSFILTLEGVDLEQFAEPDEEEDIVIVKEGIGDGEEYIDF